VVKKKKPLLSVSIERQDWLLHRKKGSGLWRTRRGSFGQMRLKSIGLGQMEESGSGNRRERD
jgi:ribosomal protein L32E